MSFGLKNAPATFQRAMNKVLEGQEDHLAAYIDDVVIFSNSWEEHLGHIRVVLEALRQNGLSTVPEAKVQALENYMRPKTKKDLQAFLGITGYYRRFIEDYATHLFHFTSVQRSQHPQLSNGLMICVVNFLIYVMLMFDCILMLPKHDDVFVVQTDASGKEISGILSVCRKGIELPMAYYSKKLTPAETRYAATELEGLAVVRSIQHFSHYMIGRSFTVETDHHSLAFH